MEDPSAPAIIGKVRPRATSTRTSVASAFHTVLVMFLPDSTTQIPFDIREETIGGGMRQDGL